MISKKGLFLSLMLFFSISIITGQEAKTAEKTIENQALPESNPIREEIQRYMGYEELLPRYLTIPFDANINTNVINNLMDPGFLMILWMPVVFILGFWRKPKLAFATGLIFMLVLAIFSHYSYIVTWEGKKYPPRSQMIEDYLWNSAFWKDPTAFIVSSLYYFLYLFTDWMPGFFNRISGQMDGVTYPFMVALFISGFFLLKERIKHITKDRQAFIFMAYFFGFLWWLFSAGIIWYGFLLLPFNLLLLFDYFSRKRLDSTFKLWSSAFFSSVVLYIVLFFTLMLSNVKNREDTGNDIIDAAVILYHLGSYSEEQAINNYYNSIDRAMAVINKDDKGLVYKAGTMLTFLVRKNNTRIWEDNLLDLFNQINSGTNAGDQEKIINTFKSLGFRYLMIGLRLGAIDQTPDGALRKKFESLITFLFRNPNLKLLATDNQVYMPDPKTGKKKIVNNVFGELHKIGTYAIYEIK